MKKWMTVYLAGYISGNKIKQCSAWRIKIREHYNKWLNKETTRIEPYPITWLEPLNGETFGVITDDGLKCDLPGKALVARDHKCVKIADLLIANTDTFGDKRPLTGTIYELAWAWTYKIPTIIITDNKNYREHPFIQDTASIIVKSVDELLDKKYIDYFYKGLVSAEYTERG